MPTILVIDDDELLRSSVRDALEAHGFMVMAAADGDEGLRTAQAHPPDLVLCDVYMESVDGYEVIARLRQAAPTAHTPIILMTGQPDLGGLRHGMSLGADDYLPKPFTMAALVGAIETRLRKHRALREQAERDLEELRANISMMLPHELLTPLTGILTAADVLSENARSWNPAEVENYSRLIKQAAQRLHRLINNCLIYAQIELLAADAVKLARLRQGTAARWGEPLGDLARQIAAGAGRPQDLILETVPVWVAISAPHLAKIVEELLANAFKFSKAGTPVRLTLSTQEQSVLLVVKDQGRGMTVQQIEKVSAYLQFDRKLYQQQGSGLGLTIAWRLAQLYGGDLHLESEPGQGCTVRVALLAARVPAAST